jgi:hypothetical protein
VLPAGAPIILLVDDSLARKGGKAIALGSMHHDPLLSTRRRPFSRFGHVWVVLAVWLPLPFGVVGGPRGVAVPLLFRLFVGSKRGNRVDAPSRPTSGKRYARARDAFPADATQRPTKPALAREAMALVAGWATVLAPARRVYVVGDSAYVNRTTIEDRPANVEVLGPLHPDAALFAPPPARLSGQMGRPRTKGEQRPSPTAQARDRRPDTWHRLPVTLYGRTVTPLVFRGTALWYSVLRAAPVRYVVVRDPGGRRQDAAFCCTDLGVSVRFLLETYAKRWTVEMVYPQLTKRGLGTVAWQGQGVAELHLGVGHDHSVEEELDQDPALGEGRRGESRADGGAEALNPVGNGAELDPLLGERLELTLLPVQDGPAGLQFLPLALELWKSDDLREVGVEEPPLLSLEQLERVADRRLAGVELLGQPGSAAGAGQRLSHLVGISQEGAQIPPDQLV